MSTDEFGVFLKEKKIRYEKINDSNGTTFIIEYCIVYGKYSGNTVTIGMQIPRDFPSAAPYGLHVKKNHIFKEPIPNRRDSNLGNEWEHWSRTTEWDSELRTPQHYFAQVNRWLELV